MTATDEFGNRGSSEVSWPIVVDQPPTVSIRTPAPGTRLVEGEALTINALPGDDRGVDSVTFFVEQGGTDLESVVVTDPALKTAIDSGTYLASTLHVPHRPEGSEAPVHVGVRVLDSGGQTTEQRVDLEILDDFEAPRIAILTPASAALEAGAALAFTARADDNVFVGDITAVLIDGLTETPLTIESRVRKDRTESVSVPNPASFGSVIVGTRVFADLSGQVRLPAAFANRVGATLKLVLRTRDNGINPAQSAPINVTVKGDEVPPVIRITSPGALVYERQPVNARVSITDSGEIDSYSIFISGEQEPRKQGGPGLHVKSVDATFAIDIDDYEPEDPEHNSFTLVVEATDARLNASRQVLVVRVAADKAPLVALQDASPSSEVVRGAIAYQTLTIEDDYASSTDPVALLPVYTTLRGTRTPTGEVQPSSAPSGFAPTVRFDYAEATGLGGTLSLGGEPYLTADGSDELRVWPLPDAAGGDRLRVDFGAGYDVRYHVQVFHACAPDTCGCVGFTEERVVTDAAGVAFGEVAGAGVQYALITPEVTDDATHAVVTTFIQTIRVDAGNLAAIRSYSANGSPRAVGGEAFVSVFVRDGGAASGNAMIAADAAREVTAVNARTAFSTRMPAPVAARLADLQLYAYGTDRFSDERGAQALSALSIRTLRDDTASPQLTIVSPANGTNVVAGQRFGIKVNVLDNTSGFSTLKVYDENAELVQQFAGTYGVSAYTLPFEVPANRTGGRIALTFVAEDYTGATATQQLLLPITTNAPPSLTFSAFVGESRIVAPTALNRGQFSVRKGESFTITAALGDDVGVVALRIAQAGAARTDARRSRCLRTPSSRRALRRRS